MALKGSITGSVDKSGAGTPSWTKSDLIIPVTGTLQFLSASMATHSEAGYMSHVLAVDNEDMIVQLLPTGAFGGGGSGDASGPGSSTDNAIARFDGTGGKTLQNSGVTIDDSNNISTAGNVTVSGDLSLGGGDGALTFSAAGSIKIVDDSTTSLVIEEANNAYMTFSTDNDEELITANKELLTSAGLSIGDGTNINLASAPDGNTPTISADDGGGMVISGSNAAAKGIAISGSVWYSLPDGRPAAFTLREGSNTYFEVDTTDGQESTKFNWGRTSINNAGLYVEDEVVAAFGTSGGTARSTIHYEDNFLHISGAASGMALTGSSIYVSGNLVLKSHAEMAGTIHNQSSFLGANSGGKVILTSVDDATTSAKGVASFDSGDFDVSSGAVSLKNASTGAVLAIANTSNETTVSRSNGTVTVGLSSAISGIASVSTTAAIAAGTTLAAGTSAMIGTDLTVMDDVLLKSESAKIHWGNGTSTDEIELIHDPGAGLILKNTSTADNKPAIFTLQNNDDVISATDVIGTIDFQAPNETGADAILVCAGIEAVAEASFDADENKTKLSFKVAKSEAATEKMYISGLYDGTLVNNFSININGDPANQTFTNYMAPVSYTQTPALTISSSYGASALGPVLVVSGAMMVTHGDWVHSGGIHFEGTLGTGSTENFSDFFANGMGGGQAIKIGRAGTGLGAGLGTGSLVVLNGDQVWDYASATSAESGSSGMLGVSLGKFTGSGMGAYSDGDNISLDGGGGILIDGLVRVEEGKVSNAPSSPIGKPLYISDGRAGDWDFNTTTTTNEYVRLVGHCVAYDGTDFIMHFRPDSIWLQLD